MVNLNFVYKFNKIKNDMLDKYFNNIKNIVSYNDVESWVDILFI